MAVLNDWWRRRRPAPPIRRQAGATRSGPFLEPLEPRQLLAAHLGYYFAPASVADGTFTATIATGTAPLQTAGSYTIQPTAVPQAGVGATGIISTDTYSYSRTGQATAILRFTDAATGTTYTDALTFSSTDDTTGTFTLAPATAGAAGGVGGTQTGTFTFAAAVPPIGGDAIATIIPNVTKATVEGNSTQVAAVKISNAGSLNSIGFIGATYYLSPDGLLADATPLGTSGRFLLVRNTANALATSTTTNSFNNVLHFSVPNLPSGAYYLVVSLTPSLQFTDTDRGNDLASSAVPIQVVQRSYDLAVSKVAVHAVGDAGQQSGVAVIQNTADTPAVGLVRIDLAAVAADGSQTPVSPQGIPVTLDLAPHTRLVLPVHFTSGEAASFVGTVETSGLSTVAQPFVSLQTTLVSAGPVSVQVPGAVPGALNGNRLARVIVSVTDAGNVPLFGRVAVNLEASNDVDGESPTILTSVEKNLLLNVNGHAQFPVDFRVPATLDTGSYYLLAQLGPSLTTLTVATYTTRLTVPVGNLAPSAAPVLVVKPPVPTLTATVLPLPSATVTTTADQSVSVVLTNTGTGPARGQYLIQIVASAIGNANAVGRIPLIVGRTESLNLPAGGSTTITLTVRLANRLLRFASQFVLLANIDAAGIDNITDIVVQGASTQVLTLVRG